ncbi:hypothetical protein RCL1_006360 [Eukaryota sp. TZLM3-RCL]
MSALSLPAIEASIDFYVLNKLPGHVAALIEDSLERRGSDPVLLFWKAVSNVLLRSFNEATRELQRLKSSSIPFSVNSVLLYIAQQQTLFSDESAIQDLESACEDTEGSASNSDLITCSRFFFLTNNITRAREIIARVFKRAGDTSPVDAFIMRGWLEYAVALSLTNDEEKKKERLKRAIKSFKQATKMDESLAAPRFGQAFSLLEAGSSTALSSLVPLLSQPQSDLKSLQELRLMTMVRSRDWMSSLVLAEELSKNGSLIGTQIALFCLLGKNESDFDVEIFIQYTSHLTKLALSLEGKNLEFLSLIGLSIACIDSSLSFTFVDHRQKEAQKVSLFYFAEKLINHVIKVDQSNLIVLFNRIKYLMVINELEQAIEYLNILLPKIFNQSITNDDESDEILNEIFALEANLLLFECLIFSQNFEKAKIQLEMIENLITTSHVFDQDDEIFEPNIQWRLNILKTKRVYLEILMSIFQNFPPRHVILSNLTACLSKLTHLIAISTLTSITDHVILNLPFLLSLMSSILNHYGLIAFHNVIKLSLLSNLIDFSTALSNLFPSHPVINCLQSRLIATNDDVIKSIKMIDRCINCFEDPAVFYLQKAFILASCLDFNSLLFPNISTKISVSLSESLETSLSIDFTLRKGHLYHYLFAISNLIKKDYEVVLNSCLYILEESGAPLPTGLGLGLGMKKMIVSEREKLGQKFRNFTTFGLFSGQYLSPIFQVDVVYFLSFVLIQKTTPEIFRKFFDFYFDWFKNDYELISRLHYYRGILESNFCNSNSFALSHLSLVSPKSEAFLASKIFQANIYYAETNISKFLSCHFDLLQSNSGLLKAEIYSLLGDAYVKLTRHSLALESYNNGIEVLKSIKSQSKSTGITSSLSNLTAKIARLYTSCHQFNSAIVTYCTSLEQLFSPIVAQELITLLSKLGKKEEIQKIRAKYSIPEVNQSAQINTSSSTEKSSNNEDQSKELILLINQSIEENQLNTAITHLFSLNSLTPNNLKHLTQLCLLLRYNGRLDEIRSLLEINTDLLSTETIADLNYVKGLYHRFRGSYKLALEHFSRCSSTLKLKESSLLQMVSIYLTVGGVFKVAEKKSIFSRRSTDQIRRDFDTPVSEVISMSMREEHARDSTIYSRSDSTWTSLQNSAEDLLSRIPKGYFSEERLSIVFQIYCKLISKDKRLITEATAVALSAFASDPDWIPGILCLATCHVHSNQEPKARSLLKRITKANFSSENAEDLELACLLYAQLYIQTKKFENASQLCDKVLAHNKSSFTAWELKGDIDEQDHAYRDAAENFLKAWTYSGKESAVIGYKLAFNYLKAEQYNDAIDVCQAVLLSNPNYDAIKHDVLWKAREKLRP